MAENRERHEINKQVKAGKQQALDEALQRDDGGWHKVKPWHWVRMVGGGEQIDYWPTTRKYRFLGQTVYDVGCEEIYDMMASYRT